MPRKNKKKDTSSALAGTLAAFNQADTASPAINLTTPASESEADQSTEPVADKPDSDPTPEPDTESTTPDAQSEPEPETVATNAKSKSKPTPKPASAKPESTPESDPAPAAEPPSKNRQPLDLELLQAYEKWQQNFERSDYQPLNRKLFVTLCQQGIIPPPPVDIYIASEKTRWAYARQALQQALRYHTATVLTTLVELQKDE